MKEKILQFISDPDFIKVQNLISEPNFFKIVGRTHTERWHSAFWGWLLDKNGSHNLEDYPITRLLTLLINSKVLKASNPDISNFFPYKQINESLTRPNEIDGNEFKIEPGSLDIYIDLNVTNLKNQISKVNIIIELKVDSSIRPEQSIKYAEWQKSTKVDHNKLLIYFLQGSDLNENSFKTVGDERWFCISYQLLHDLMLNPILNHPSLSLTAKLIIQQYIKNMRLTNKGVKMATTQEETDLINNIYENYGDVIDTIFQVVYPQEKIEEAVSASSDSSSRSKGKIVFELNHKSIEGKSGADVLDQTLKYIVDNNFIKQIPLPWGTGTKRYILTNSNNLVHPNGRYFFAPKIYKEYAIETHYNRVTTMKTISDIAQQLNLDYKLIEAQL